MNKIMIASVISCIFFVGCAHPDNATNNINDADEGQKTIVVSFYPLAFITQMIVGNHAHVVNLAGSQEIHEYALSPDDLKVLYDADLVVFLGSGLERWTEDVIPQLESKGISTLDVTHDMTLFSMSNEVEHNTHYSGLQENNEYDPHIWTDPIYAKEITQKIARAIIAIDEKNADVYTLNTQKSMDEFDLIDQEYVKGLKTCARRQTIISHEAFGYIARRYGITLHAIAGLSTMDEPSTQFLVALKEEAEAEGITHILVEKNSVQKFSQTVAQTAHLEMLPIYSLERVVPDNQKTYFDMMRENLQVLRIALQCE